MASKYLIVDNKFLMSSSIDYHVELLPKEHKIISGGGRFHLDHDNKRIILYDKSDQFKGAKKEDILSALENSFLSMRLDGYAIYITESDLLSQALVVCKSRIEPDYVYIM